MIPTNAKAIIKARMQGFRPDELILISLIGKISQNAHTVLADPAKAYDWRWVRDIDVCVYINGACDWRGTTLQIRKAMPRYMWLWDVDSRRGASVYLRPTHPAGEPKHVRDWDWKLEFSSWWPCQNENFAKEVGYATHS